MKCPFCGTPDTRVVDSRLAAESSGVGALLALAPPIDMYAFPEPWAGEPPLLLVAGSEDPLSPEPLLRSWAERRSAELAILPDASHLLFERLGELQRVVGNFARRVVGDAP